MPIALVPVAWLHPTEPWPLMGFVMLAFWLLVLGAVLWFVRRWNPNQSEPDEAARAREDRDDEAARS